MGKRGIHIQDTSSTTSLEEENILMNKSKATSEIVNMSLTSEKEEGNDKGSTGSPPAKKKVKERGFSYKEKLK